MYRNFLDRKTPPVLFTLVMMAGVSAMSMNVFLPALQDMADHFQTDYALVQLSVAVYLGVNAMLQLIIGPISDRFGRRPVLLWSSGLFCVATLGCIYAPTIETFLIARMAQAVIVATMVLSRAIVRDIVGPEQAASMIGYVTMGMALVPMIAPGIGGVLNEQFGWQSSFWFLFVSGVGLTCLIWADSGETHHKRSSSLGAQIRDYPELFRSPRFWGYAASAAFASGAYFAYLGGAAYVGGALYGLRSDVLGLYFSAPAIGYLVGNGLAGRYAQDMGINRMVLVGAVINALGLTVLALLFIFGFGSAALFFGFMTCVGLGNGMVIPNATAGMLSVRPHLAGSASGLGGSLMIGGGGLLSAIAGLATQPGATALPLIFLMLSSGLLGVVAALLVIWREKRRQIRGC